MVSGHDPTMPSEGPPEYLPTDPSSSMRPPVNPDFETSTDPQMQARMLLGAELEELARMRKDPSAYILRGEVGHGTFGEVLEAVQVALHRIVAVKRPRTPAAATESERADQSRLAELLFHKEALTTSHLDHPNIVPVYDLGTDSDGRPLLAMKLVEGVAWNRQLRDDAELALPERLARHLPSLLLVSRAVAFAHSRGIIHRDLKPSQVMVGNYGEVFLMDWGSAVAMPDTELAAGMPASNFATPLEIAPNPAGTVAYMAPEQTLRSPDQLGPWTDVYLLGGMLYEILTCTCPHPQERPADAFMHAARGVVELPEERASGQPVPPDLSMLCMWALAPRISERMQTAAEFVQSLESWLSGASLREQSRILTGDAQALLANARQGYSDLDQADALAVRALNAWAENREAQQLQDDILSRYVETAITAGDLKLAAAQAQRIRESAQREKIQHGVIRAERISRRHRAQRRIAIITSLMLLFGISALGLFLRYNMEADRIFEDRLADQQRQNRAAIAEALAKRQADTRRGEQLQRLGELRDSTTAFVNRVSRDIPLPEHIEPQRDWSWDYLVSQKQTATEMRHALAKIESLRAQCIQDGLTVSAEPYEVQLAAATLALQSNAEPKPQEAYNIFSRAAQAAPLRFDAVFAMAIAAARSGDLTSATQDSNAAISRINTGGSFYDSASELRRELIARTTKGFVAAPDDIIIEACDTGINHQKFHALTDNWTEIARMGGYKSVAPALSGVEGSSAMVFHYYEPLKPSEYFPVAVARFTPDPPQPRRLHVYATWPARGNAFPVRYRIHHADGETSVALVQDGWGEMTGSPNSHLWVSLGEYSFLPGDRTYVDVEADDDVRPVTPQRHAEVVADAMYFAAKPLDVDTTEPLLSPVSAVALAVKPHEAVTTAPAKLQWSSSFSAARKQAAAEKKALMVFAYYPVSAIFTHPLSRYHEYCENRLFVDPAFVAAFNDSAVAAMVDISKDAETLRQLGMDPSGTSICVCSPTGEVRERITGKALMLAPLELAAKLQAAVGP